MQVICIEPNTWHTVGMNTAATIISNRIVMTVETFWLPRGMRIERCDERIDGSFDLEIHIGHGELLIMGIDGNWAKEPGEKGIIVNYTLKVKQFRGQEQMRDLAHLMGTMVRIADVLEENL